jgi:hypothetical protein
VPEQIALADVDMNVGDFEALGLQALKSKSRLEAAFGGPWSFALVASLLVIMGLVNGPSLPLMAGAFIAGAAMLGAKPLLAALIRLQGRRRRASEPTAPYRYRVGLSSRGLSVESDAGRLEVPWWTVSRAESAGSHCVLACDAAIVVVPGRLFATAAEFQAFTELAVAYRQNSFATSETERQQWRSSINDALRNDQATEVTFVPTLRDMRAFFGPAFRRSWRQWLGPVAVFAIIAPGWSVLSPGRMDWQSTSATMLLGAAFGFGFFRVHRWEKERREVRRSLRPREVWHVGISGRAVWIDSNYGSSAVPWTAVERVESWNDYCRLMWGDTLGCMVPRTAFSSDQRFAAFIRAAKRYHEAARAA